MRVEHRRRPDVKWYAFSAPHYFCPHCGVELSAIVSPLGRALNFAMILVACIFLIELWSHPSWRGSMLVLGAPLPVLLIFIECYKRFGFHYVVVRPEADHAL